VLVGGARRADGPGIFFEPTVLVGVDHTMEIMREETFGPVIPVMAVRDAEEAVRLANECDYGLSASVWTRDVARGVALAQRLETGNVCVNDCLVSAGVQTLPFGGVKKSGVGARHGGREGLWQFCVRQALLIESRRRRSEPAWFPYSARRARLIERLMGWWAGWR
jgi:acyl-CoA reductase-like NAD-dependent aldehyde dehydrogenase